MKNDLSYRTLFTYTVFIAAYAYLAWRLITYSDYASLKQTFACFSCSQSLALLLCILLMPLNLCLEALRWRQTICPVEKISTQAAYIQVLGGIAGAFITPYRAGEIPARVAMLPNTAVMPQAIALGIYGSLIMTAVVVASGMVPALFWLQGSMTVVVLYSVAALVLTVAFGFGIRHYASRHKELDMPVGSVVLYSFLRYFCFSLQLYLMLIAVGIELSVVQALVAIPTYYALVTISPNMPVADLGLRGSWAVFVFSRYSSAAPSVALAAGAMWVVNSVLPLVFSLPFVLRGRKSR